MSDKRTTISVRGRGAVLCSKREYRLGLQELQAMLDGWMRRGDYIFPAGARSLPRRQLIECATQTKTKLVAETGGAYVGLVLVLP